MTHVFRPTQPPLSPPHTHLPTNLSHPHPLWTSITSQTHAATLRAPRICLQDWATSTARHSTFPGRPLTPCPLSLSHDVMFPAAHPPQVSNASQPTSSLPPCPQVGFNRRYIFSDLFLARGDGSTNRINLTHGKALLLPWVFGYVCVPSYFSVFSRNCLCCHDADVHEEALFILFPDPARHNGVLNGV